MTKTELRAADAIRQLGGEAELGRSFDLNFESGDGDDVLRIIVAKAAIDPKLAADIRERGFGYWLEPTYLATRCD